MMGTRTSTCKALALTIHCRWLCGMLGLLGVHVLQSKRVVISVTIAVLSKQRGEARMGDRPSDGQSRRNHQSLPMLGNNLASKLMQIQVLRIPCWLLQA
jgi:hypothetical protein